MISRFLLCSIFLTLSAALPLAANAEDKKEEKADAAADDGKSKEAGSESAAPATHYDFPFVCEADISYTWKPLPPPPKELPTPTDPKAAEELAKQKEAALNVEPITVFYKRAGAEGREEADVRRKLAFTLQNAKKAALDFCAEKHQDQASCISKGFTKIRNEYREADFNLRKPLLDSIVKSCEANYGVCTTATAGETVCYENRPPELRPKAVEETPEKK